MSEVKKEEENNKITGVFVTYDKEKKKYIHIKELTSEQYERFLGSIMLAASYYYTLKEKQYIKINESFKSKTNESSRKDKNENQSDG